MGKYYDIIIIGLLIVILILIIKNRENYIENWTDTCSGSSETNCDVTNCDSSGKCTVGKCTWSNDTCYNAMESEKWYGNNYITTPDSCPAEQTPCTDSSQICRQPTMSMQCSAWSGDWSPGPLCPCKPGDTLFETDVLKGCPGQYFSGPPDGSTDTYIQYGCAQSQCCKDS